MKDNFKFVETEKSKGFVNRLRNLASEAGRSLNNYIEQLLKKHLEDNKE
jgi:predicted HicB family RNase H-like nuclease